MNRNVALDLDFVRAQFPAFQDPRLGQWAFFENAGGSYVPETVIDRLSRFLVEKKVQPYAPFEASAEAGVDIDRAERDMAEMINAEPGEIVIGASTTMNIYVLANAMRGWLRPGDEIIVTNQDHEANGGAWRRLADAGTRVREWRIDPDSGELELDALGPLLSARTRLVCFPHCSNIVGTFNDAAAIARLAHRAGAMVMIDGVSYAPHGRIDVKALDADFYAFSLYKTYGPHLAILYGRRQHLERLDNQNHEQIADEVPLRLNPGGLNHEETAALSGITDYYDAVYAHHFSDSAASRVARLGRIFELFADHEERLCGRLLDYLRAKPAIRIIGRRRAGGRLRAPTISFTVANRRSHDVVAALSERKLALRAGSFYAWRCVQALGIDPKDGVVRASMVHYNTLDEVDRLIAGLEAAL